LEGARPFQESGHRWAVKKAAGSRNLLSFFMRTQKPFYDLEFDTGEVISPMIYTEREWNSKYKVTPFYQNAMREDRLL